MPKFKKYKLLTVILAAYTIIVGICIYPSFKTSGRTSIYVGMLVICSVLIILLAYLLKKRE